MWLYEVYNPMVHADPALIYVTEYTTNVQEDVITLAKMLEY